LSTLTAKIFQRAELGVQVKIFPRVPVDLCQTAESWYKEPAVAPCS